MVLEQLSLKRIYAEAHEKLVLRKRLADIVRDVDITVKENVSNNLENSAKSSTSANINRNQEKNIPEYKDENSNNNSGSSSESDEDSNMSLERLTLEFRLKDDNWETFIKRLKIYYEAKEITEDRKKVNTVNQNR